MEGPLSLDALGYPTRRLVAIFTGAAAVFLGLAVFVWSAGDDVPRVDEAVFNVADGHQSRPVNSFVRAIGRLGGTEVVVPIGVACAAVVCVKRRSLTPLAIVLISYAFAAWWTLRFKHLLNRHEPYDTPTDLGLSFPSGHLSQSTSVYLALFVLAVLFRRPVAIRVLTAIALLVVAVAILYRSAHWATDVVGGTALGVAGVCTGILAVRGAEWALAERDRRRAGREPDRSVA